MKKWLILILAILLFAPCALCEEADWSASPVITKAYELSGGKLYLEWEGNAPVYQVYMDGESVAEAVVSNAIIHVEQGTHTLNVYPVSENTSGDTKVDLNFNIVSFDLDLAALGLDHKNLTAGTSSLPLNIDYVENPILSAAPEKPEAFTDFDDFVHLTFTDRYNADEYRVAIKAGNDVNYVSFNQEEAANLITKTNSAVTLCLDAAYLQNHGCMVPELDNKYSFTVQLRKYAVDMLTGQKITTVIHESKESGSCTYTPTAAWKNQPVISYASQTADGQITLEWTHDDNGLGCKYAVMKLSKKLGIQTGEEEAAVVSERSCILNDLLNGKQYFAVVPLCGNERGNASAEAVIDVQNEWMVAPVLECEAQENNQVKLRWSGAEGVETYRITVCAGNNDSLLRFVDLDFTQYTQVEVTASVGPMEYLFSYADNVNPETGVKLKFEICGVRHAQSGEEQTSAASSQTITIGQIKEAAN